MPLFTQLVGQSLLNLRHRPGTLIQELIQCLFVGASDPRRHRLHGFTFSVQEQALHINSSPVPPLASSDRLDQIFQEPDEPSLHPVNCFGVMAQS